MAGSSRVSAFRWIGITYAAALLAACAVAARLGNGMGPLHVVAYADMAATGVVFAFSVLLNNSSVYDPYWSVAPMVIAPWLTRRDVGAPASGLRQTIVCGLVLVWGVRLTYNWARGFRGMAHEDWRYAEARGKVGLGYWPASLLAFHLFPTVQVYLGCLPLWPALSSPRPFGVLDAVAGLVTLGAIALETVADEQLRAFRADAQPGAIMMRGVWAHSRHPNYVGEIGFWFGLFLFGIAADPGALWCGAGVVAITLMFVLASVPMLDRRSAERRPGYAEHMKRVPMLIGWRRHR